MASEPRPIKPTKELRLQAAMETARRALEAGLISRSEIAELANDIVRSNRGPYTDGYELAKELEFNFGWECNFHWAEILDGHSCSLRAAIGRAEKEWAERTNPQPPLAIGTAVKLCGAETGVIDGIYKYAPAKYTVKVDGDPQAAPPTCSRRIINFEDAVAA